MMMIISSGNAYRSNFILDKTHSTPTHLIFFEYIHPHHLKKIKIPLPQSPKISSSQRECCFPTPHLKVPLSQIGNINFHFLKSNVNLTTYKRVTQRTFTFSSVAFILEKKNLYFFKRSIHFMQFLTTKASAGIIPPLHGN